MPTELTINVLLVDDHKVVRLGLRTALADSERIRVVGEEGTVDGGVREALRLKPHVAVIDIRLPDGSGFDVCRKIKQTVPAVRVLMLSSYVDDNLVLEALGAGADGYLLKQIEEQDIAGAIETIAEGGAVMDSTVTRGILRHAKGDLSTKVHKLADLSSQERRVLELVAAGKTNRQVAAGMKLGEKTVRNYLSNIFGKLQMTRRSEAAAWFVRQMKS